MADGWRCPECALILAPHVNEHRCDPDPGGVSVRPVVAPYEPPSSASVSYTWGTARHGGGFVSYPGAAITASRSLRLIPDPAA